MSDDRKPEERAAMKQASIAIVVAMLVWLALNSFGGFGLPARFVFLVDMLCLAAFAWALWVVIRIWRAGAGTGKGS